MLRFILNFFTTPIAPATEPYTSHAAGKPARPLPARPAFELPTYTARPTGDSYGLYRGDLLVHPNLTMEQAKRLADSLNTNAPIRLNSIGA